MTDKLFWTDAYATQCSAIITYVDGNSVMIDQTVLFAFSGGQASDRGTINGIPVVSAVKSDEDIVYTLEGPHELSVGDEVLVKLDWEFRHKIMKLHSAAHVVLFLFEEKHGKKPLIGSNISYDKARLDFENGESIGPFLTEVEAEVNAMIAMDEAAHMSFLENGRRQWKCGPFDCECGGTHVRALGEIGEIKLKRKNIGAGKERIEVSLV